MLNHFKFGQLNSLLGLPVELMMYLWQCKCTWSLINVPEHGSIIAERTCICICFTTPAMPRDIIKGTPV